MNKGKFVGDKYIKEVCFSKAVLWCTKEISINPEIAHEMVVRNVKELVFIDKKKKERWSIGLLQARKNAVLKAVGQEPQFYLPIDLFKKVVLK